MTKDASDLLLPHAANFSVGLVVRDGFSGSRVLGSAVLVDIQGRRGLLTCGHVAEAYRDLSEIGLVRYIANQERQARILKLAHTDTVLVTNGDEWTENGLDLAFTRLTPDAASSIGAQSLFLNLEFNRAKIDSGEPDLKRSVALVGLVAEFSAEPFIEDARWISPMRGILHPGKVIAQENGLLIFEANKENVEKMPKKFGGMSGGGLWSMYLNEDKAGHYEAASTRLVGIASWQIDDSKIACQGWPRITDALIPLVREKMP